MFCSQLRKKYGSTISVAEFLFERLKFNNIRVGFVSKPNNKMGEELIKPFIEASHRVKGFDLIQNMNEMRVYYSALNYNEATRNVGVVINNSYSDFEEFNDVLCCSNSLLSLCLYESSVDLNNFIKRTTSIHPCFKSSETIHVSNMFPSILDNLLRNCKTHPVAPVHINISTKMLDEVIDIQDTNHKINKNKAGGILCGVPLDQINLTSKPKQESIYKHDDYFLKESKIRAGYPPLL